MPRLFVTLVFLWWCHESFLAAVSCCCFLFQAEGGIRDLVRSRGLGDVYKRQGWTGAEAKGRPLGDVFRTASLQGEDSAERGLHTCLLYTSDAADERSSVDLGGRRIIKKKNNCGHTEEDDSVENQQERERSSKETAKESNKTNNFQYR